MFQKDEIPDIIKQTDTGTLFLETEVIEVEVVGLNICKVGYLTKS